MIGLWMIVLAHQVIDNRILIKVFWISENSTSIKLSKCEILRKTLNPTPLQLEFSNYKGQYLVLECKQSFCFINAKNETIHMNYKLVNDGNGVEQYQMTQYKTY